MYHLTVVSGGGPNAGTQYEQLVQKLMETDGDPSELNSECHCNITFHNLPDLIILSHISNWGTRQRSG
jgi:hypothetical protein